MTTISKPLSAAHREAAHREETRTQVAVLTQDWSAEIVRSTGARAVEVQSEALDAVFSLVTERGHGEIAATAPREQGLPAVVQHINYELNRLDAYHS